MSDIVKNGGTKLFSGARALCAAVAGAYPKMLTLVSDAFDRGILVQFADGVVEKIGSQPDLAALDRTGVVDCTTQLQAILDLVGVGDLRIPKGTYTFTSVTTKANLICHPEAFLNGIVTFDGQTTISTTNVRAAAVVLGSTVDYFYANDIYVDGSKFTGANGLDGFEALQTIVGITIKNLTCVNCGGETIFKGGVSITGAQGERLSIGKLTVQNCYTHGIQIGTVNQTDPTKYAFEQIDVGVCFIKDCGGTYDGDNKRHGVYLTNALHTHFGSCTVWNQTNGNCIQIGKLTAGNSGRVRFDEIDLDTQNYDPATAIKGCISIADDAPIVSFGTGRIANFKEYGVQIYNGQLIDMGSCVFERPGNATGIPAVVVRGNCGKIDLSRATFRGWYDTTRRGVSYGVVVGDTTNVTVGILDVSGSYFENLQYHAVQVYAGSTINWLSAVATRVYRSGGVFDVSGTLGGGRISGVWANSLGAISTAWKLPTNVLSLLVEENVINSGGTTVRLNDMKWTRMSNVTQFDTTYWIDTGTGIAYVAKDYDLQIPDASLSDGFGAKIYHSSSGGWIGFGKMQTTIASVTQTTNKSTGVTLNATSGRITMDSAALAADTSVSFTLTNSKIDAKSQIAIHHESAGTAGKYLVTANPASGSATVTVTNIGTGSLSEAIVLRFTLETCL
jgi:hypothetical protein